MEDIADLAEHYSTFDRILKKARRAARLRQEGRFYQGDVEHVTLKC